MSEFKFSSDKLKQAILLFIHTANNGLLGKTKLFKMLYYADFDHFERTGSPITGETYLRYEHGPFPEHGDRTLKMLSDEELIGNGSAWAGKYLQYTYEPLALFDLSVFAPEEVKTLVDVLHKWEKHNATEMVAATHGEAPWIATSDRQHISYSLAYYRNKYKEMDVFLEEDDCGDVALEDTG